MLVGARGRPRRSGRKMNQCAVSQSVKEKAYVCLPFKIKRTTVRSCVSDSPRLRAIIFSFRRIHFTRSKVTARQSQSQRERFLQLEKERKKKLAWQFVLNLKGQEIYGLFMSMAPKGPHFCLSAEFCKETLESPPHTADQKCAKNYTSFS